MKKINFHKFIWDILERKKKVYTYFKVFFQLLEINEKNEKRKRKLLNDGADLKWATAHLYCKTRFVLQYEVAGLGGLYCKAENCIAVGWVYIARC